MPRLISAFTEVYRWLTRDSEEYLVVAPLVGVELDGQLSGVWRSTQ